jgi:hypothetical protein
MSVAQPEQTGFAVHDLEILFCNVSVSDIGIN